MAHFLQEDDINISELLGEYRTHQQTRLPSPLLRIFPIMKSISAAFQLIRLSIFICYFISDSLQMKTFTRQQFKISNVINYLILYH